MGIPAVQHAGTSGVKESDGAQDWNRTSTRKYADQALNLKQRVCKGAGSRRFEDLRERRGGPRRTLVAKTTPRATPLGDRWSITAVGRTRGLLPAFAHRDERRRVLIDRTPWSPSAAAARKPRSPDGSRPLAAGQVGSSLTRASSAIRIQRAHAKDAEPEVDRHAAHPPAQGLERRAPQGRDRQGRAPPDA